LLEEVVQLNENGKTREGIVVSCGVPHYEEALHTAMSSGANSAILM
jgi:electron transfer flavoprotein alpha/beta subunit